MRCLDTANKSVTNQSNHAPNKKNDNAALRLKTETQTQTETARLKIG